jgi:hypothetical protein
VYPSVEKAFLAENDKLEGVSRKPYVDVKGLVTTAVGYLVDREGGTDPPPSMFALPWKRDADGGPASEDEVRAAWLAVKHSGLEGVSGLSERQQSLTTIHLDDAGILQATHGWIADAEPNLRRDFPGYDAMQADAQLGVLLLSYALGSNFSREFPKFTAAVNAPVPDWTTAAEEGQISTRGNPGVRDRDADVRVMFENAARAQHTNVPYDVLWWPGTTPPAGYGSPGGGGATVAGRVVAGVLAATATAAALLAWKAPEVGRAIVRAPGRAVAMLAEGGKT